MYVLLEVGVSRLRNQGIPSPKLVLDRQCLLYNLVLGHLVCKRMFDNEKKRKKAAPIFQKAFVWRQPASASLALVTLHALPRVLSST